MADGPEHAILQFQTLALLGHCPSIDIFAAMKGGTGVIASVLGGAAFGAATSLINDVSSPHGLIGSRIADTGWQWAAEVASLLVGLGWAWAGLAIAAGWLTGASFRGALAGVVALLAATTAYYGMDSVLREDPFALYWSEMPRFWLASVVFGIVLGVVGASIRRPGVIGLLAGLALPVVATTQMILLPSTPTVTPVTSAETCARVIVWVAAALGAGVVIIRFGRSRLNSATRPGQRCPPN